MALASRIPPSVARWAGRQQFRPIVGPIIKASASRLRHGARVVPSGQAKGLRIDPSGANAGYALGTTEPMVQDLFAELLGPESVVWDVGANIGFYTLIAARLSKTVVAFEPLPVNIAAIRRNLDLNEMNNVTLVEGAVSDHEGRAELELHGEQTWAKLDTSADTEFKRSNARVPSLTVRLLTLDEQLNTLRAPSLVKIDIEGAEVAALRGARRLLKDVRPIILCELHGTNSPVMDLLDDCGYTATTVEDPEVTPRNASWSAHIVASPT